MADIVIFGAGRLADVAKVYIDAHGPDRVVGFTVDEAYHEHGERQGLPVIPWERLEARFPPSEVKLLGPISYRRMNDLREERHLEGRRRGYAFASFIHPATHIYTDAIGENCFILEGNVVQPFARIGDGVILWSGNHVGHHSVVGDYCFFSSQIGVGSGVTLGRKCFVGGQVGIETSVQVGEACFLGSGARVKKNLPDESVVPGEVDAVAPYPSSRLKRLRFR